MRKRVIIMGAAGRDFHNFNMCFRDEAGYDVRAFTAAQIPFIHGRTYPPGLAGPLYPGGIPIVHEDRLPGLIKDEKINEAVFSYSDVTHAYVMHKAAMCAALGADFRLLGAGSTMLASKRPVISICAVRTGCGKSGVTKYIASYLREIGIKAVAIRHPMPYGDLLAQRVQRFATKAGIINAGSTIEEMEEFEPLVEDGTVVYAGVDYAEVLKAAEKEAEVILWDGGNNDMPFIRPGLDIVIADPLRPGDELDYYPGEANLRRADCVIINKANAASPGAIALVEKNVRSVNPAARVIKTASTLSVGGDITGRKVLIIEDGPTLTHGGMIYGAGTAAARMHKAIPVDPRPYAAGTIADTFLKYPGLKDLLPAMGYSEAQKKELEGTINATPCDIVLVATPIDLSSVIKINKPVVRVRYAIEEMEDPGLRGIVENFIKGIR